MLAGTLADSSEFESEPIDTDCYRCGGDTVVDYSDSMLTWRCTNCEGAFQGTLASVYRPPVGLEGRTPHEVHRDGNTWDRHRLTSMMEGVCPDCSGAVTGTLHRCDDHDTHDRTVCKECGTFWKVQSTFVCEVCKGAWNSAGWAPIFTEIAVLAFFHAHGLDVFALIDESDLGVLDEVLEMAVQATEPLEVAVTVSFDDDHLTVTLDDEAQVIDVTEGAGTTA